MATLRAGRLVLLIAALAPASLSSAGCATLDVVPAKQMHMQTLAPGTTPIAHVRAANWGWYLFKFIPIFTGDLESPGYPQMCRIFRDNVTVGDVVGKVSDTCDGLGATEVTDLQTSDKSEWQGWTLIFWINEIEASANASRREPQPVRDRAPEAGLERR
jgi:hypothetical protein